jgi:hypothetical protein
MVYISYFTKSILGWNCDHVIVNICYLTKSIVYPFKSDILHISNSINTNSISSFFWSTTQGILGYFFCVVGAAVFVPGCRWWKFEVISSSIQNISIVATMQIEGITRLEKSLFLIIYSGKLVWYFVIWIYVFIYSMVIWFKCMRCEMIQYYIVYGNSWYGSSVQVVLGRSVLCGFWFSVFCVSVVCGCVAVGCGAGCFCNGSWCNLATSLPRILLYYYYTRLYFTS